MLITKERLRALKMNILPCAPMECAGVLHAKKAKKERAGMLMVLVEAGNP